jgi:hypothetical protein
MQGNLLKLGTVHLATYCRYLDRQRRFRLLVHPVKDGPRKWYLKILAKGLA